MRMQTAVYLIVAGVTGVFYASASYLAAIKSIAALSQTQINTIGACAYIGACAPMFIVGWLADRYADWVSSFSFLWLMIGTFGYAGLYGLLTYNPTEAPVPALALMMGLVGKRREKRKRKTGRKMDKWTEGEIDR